MSQQSDIDALLTELRSYRVVLIPTERTVAAWCPGVNLPTRTRQAIARNRRELLQLIRLSDARTCVNPSLHRQYWSYRAYSRLSPWCCDMCAHLRPEVEGTWQEHSGGIAA